MTVRFSTGFAAVLAATTATLTGCDAVLAPAVDRLAGEWGAVTWIDVDSSGTEFDALARGRMFAIQILTGGTGTLSNYRFPARGEPNGSTGPAGFLATLEGLLITFRGETTTFRATVDNDTLILSEGRGLGGGPGSITGTLTLVRRPFVANPGPPPELGTARHNTGIALGDGFQIEIRGPGGPDTTYYSDRTDIATVDARGAVTGTSVGVAHILVRSGGRASRIRVEVLDVQLARRVYLPSIVQIVRAAAGGVAYTMTGSQDFFGRSAGVLYRFDIATGQPTDSVAVRTVPRSFDLSSDGETAYITHLGSNVLSVVDLPNLTVHEVPVAGAAEELSGARVSPDGAWLFVFSEDSLYRLQLPSLAVSHVTPFGADYTPWLAFDPMRPVAYAATYGGRIILLDVTTHAVISEWQAGWNLTGVAVHPSGTEVYVCDDGHGEQLGLVILDGTNGDVLESVATGPNHDVLSDPGGRFIYLSSGQNGVVRKFDVVSREVVETWQVGGWPQRMALDPETGSLLVANWEGWVDIIEP